MFQLISGQLILNLALIAFRPTKNTKRLVAATALYLIGSWMLTITSGIDQPTTTFLLTNSLAPLTFLLAWLLMSKMREATEKLAALAKEANQASSSKPMSSRLILPTE